MKHPGAVVLVALVVAIVVAIIAHADRTCVAAGGILAETAEGARCVKFGPEVTR